MQRNYLENREGQPFRPASPREAFQHALGHVLSGKAEQIDLITFARDGSRTKIELYSELVKQISVRGGVVFPDDQIKAETHAFLMELNAGRDALEELDRLASRQDKGSNRKTIIAENATHVDRSEAYIDKIIWEIPATYANVVIGLSMNADDSGVLSWSYYIGTPYKDRAGFHALLRNVQHAMSSVFQIFDSNMLPPDKY